MPISRYHRVFPNQGPTSRHAPLKPEPPVEEISFNPDEWGRPQEADIYETTNGRYYLVHEIIKTTNRLHFMDIQKGQVGTKQIELSSQKPQYPFPIKHLRHFVSHLMSSYYVDDPRSVNRDELIWMYDHIPENQMVVTAKIRHDKRALWLTLLDIDKRGIYIGAGMVGKVYLLPVSGVTVPGVDEQGVFWFIKNEPIFDLPSHDFEGKAQCLVKVIPRQRPDGVKVKPGSALKEARALKGMPSSKLIAFVSDDKNHYLLMKPTMGGLIDYKTFPLTPACLEEIGNALIELDASQILNWDIHFKGNILVKVVHNYADPPTYLASIIDYDWCVLGAQNIRKISQKTFLPNFVTPSNLFIFESHALFGSYFFDNLKEGKSRSPRPNTLGKMNEWGHISALDNAKIITNAEMRKVFKDTLQQVNRYVYALFEERFFNLKWDNRRERKQASNRGQAFTREKQVCGVTDKQAQMDAFYALALSEAFKNPGPQVVDLEANRVQVRFDDERDFHATQIHKHGIQEHLWWRWNTWKHAKRYMEQTQALIQDCKTNPIVERDELDRKQRGLQHTQSQEDWNSKQNMYWKVYLKYHQKLSRHYYALASQKLWRAVMDSCLEIQRKDGKTFHIYKNFKMPLLWKDIESGQVADIHQLFKHLKLPNPPKIVDNPDDYDLAAMIHQAGRGEL